MKRFCIFLLTLYIFFVCGCNTNVDQPNNTANITQSSNISTSENVCSPTINVTVTDTPVSIINSDIAEQETVTPSPTPPITSVIYGYITKVTGTAVAVNEVEIVFHKAGELDRFGDKYQSDWWEIQDTNRTYILSTTDESKHLFADVFNNNDNDDMIKLDSISNNNFLSICTKEYYDTKLYFKISFTENIILNTELLIDYYLMG